MTSKKGSPAKESPIRTQADFERYLNNADAGEAEAQYEIARLYGTGSQQLGIAADLAQSLYWVRCAAEQQYAEAFNFLGLIYTHGDGVEPSDEKAYQYYAQAAQLGSPYAMSNLAWAFFTGTGTEIDYKEALKWAKKAEESEIENAKLLLANLYYHGLGTRKNYKKAFALFLPFAQQGDGLSQYYIAQCYLLGQGVELSDAEAAKWFIKAAQQDVPEAQTQLGMMLASGSGLEPNTDAAAHWWDKAAAKGESTAELMLYYYYANEKTGNDLKKALQWLRKAAEHGEEQAIEELESMEEQALKNVFGEILSQKTDLDKKKKH
ncbi:MAG: tetratricopeptide repeat protein [Candidatus Limimorpha sp.]